MELKQACYIKREFFLTLFDLIWSFDGSHFGGYSVDTIHLISFQKYINKKYINNKNLLKFIKKNLFIIKLKEK